MKQIVLSLFAVFVGLALTAQNSGDQDSNIEKRIVIKNSDGEEVSTKIIETRIQLDNILDDLNLENMSQEELETLIERIQSQTEDMEVQIFDLESDESDESDGVWIGEDGEVHVLNNHDTEEIEITIENDTLPSKRKRVIKKIIIASDSDQSGEIIKELEDEHIRTLEIRVDNRGQKEIEIEIDAENLEREIEHSLNEMENIKIIEIDTEDGTDEKYDIHKIMSNDALEIRIRKNSSDDDDENFSWSCGNNTKLMLDLGLSTYLYDGGTFNLPSEVDQFKLNIGRSINFNIHYAFQRFAKNNKGNVGFQLGLSYYTAKYRFQDDFRLVGGQDSFIGSIDNNVTSVDKNRLATFHLGTPIRLIFRSPSSANFKTSFSLGYAPKILVASNHKLKSDATGKVKIRDDFGLNQFVHSVEARIGIGPVKFYVDYQLNRMFTSDLDPALYPLNFGIVLLTL